jgi:hypothetical protein
MTTNQIHLGQLTKRPSENQQESKIEEDHKGSHLGAAADQNRISAQEDASRQTQGRRRSAQEDASRQTQGRRSSR